MRNRSGEKIKLSGIDELLGVVNEESAMEIDIASIHPFAGHPFKVIDDCIPRSPADSDAFQSGRCAEHNGRPETPIIVS